ncbi:carboxymuconolactone decarboxylase family protein [Oceanospirillum sediminis]|nr:carboxymuconolactone decarboxylase family protein [Oceanospirillum sediminis]
MQKIDFYNQAPGAIKILLDQEEYLKACFSDSAELGMALLELVKLRVSQVNQCAFCIDMHTKDAVAMGESPQRIYALSAWRDAPFFSNRERLALDWAESLTLNQDIDDDRMKALQDMWSDADIVNLTIAVNAINSWNRIARTFKPEVGGYQSPLQN